MELAGGKNRSHCETLPKGISLKKKKKFQYALGRHRNYNLKTLVETHCPEVRQGAEIISLPGEYV